MTTQRWARLLLAAVLAAPSLASAQDAAPAPAAPRANAANEPEEIIVTARKREESVQDVPFAVSAKTGESLRQAGSDNLEDISRLVPSLSVQNLGPGQSQVAMRGISAGQIVRDQPGVKEQVGIYLDESVVSLSLFTPDLDLYDLNRVEVLRGPQGTLFGSGSVSGTVRYITNQPNLEEIEANAEGGINFVQSGGRGGAFKGMINMPLIEDKLALRVAGFWTSFPGFIDAKTPTGREHDVNDGDRIGFRAALTFQPTEAIRFTPRVAYQKVQMGGFNRVDRFNILANRYTTTRTPVTLGKREQFRQLKEKFDDNFLLADANFSIQANDWLTITSITSYTNRDLLMRRDATQLTASITGGSIGLPENVYTLDAPLDDVTHLKSVTEELRAAGNHELDLGFLTSIDWVLGYFYSNLHRNYGQTLNVPGFTLLSGIPTAGIIAGTDQLFFSRLPYDFKQEAIFGETTWTLAQMVHLTAGLRWFTFDEQRDLNFDGIFADQFIHNVNTANPTLVAPSKTNSNGFNPRFIISVTPTENLELSVQASKGFRLGGINDPLNTSICANPSDIATFGGFPTFGDERVWNYEAGAKASLFGGHATVNGAFFYNDIRDLQGTFDTSCSSRVILNIPKARSIGGEIELGANLFDQLDLSLSASYTHSELRSTVRNVVTNAPLPGASKGDRLPTVPKFQLSAAASYTMPALIKDFDGFVTLTYQHVGSRYTQLADQSSGFLNPVNLFTNVGNTSVSQLSFDPKLAPYDLANIRVGVRNEKWELAFYVDNLSDERAELALDRERGGRARVGFLTNQPRTFGLTGKVSY